MPLADANGASAVPQVSVVSPCYNESPCLTELVERITAALDGYSIEIILVDDGSTDDTRSVTDAIQERFEHVRLVRLARNFGQQNATLAGIRAARGAWCVTIDSDLQHRPEDIPGLLDQAVRENLDIIYGVPQRSPSFLQYRLGRLTKWAVRRLGGVDFADSLTAFRVFRTSMRDLFVNFSAPFVSVDSLLSWGARRVGERTVTYDVRKAGSSTYGPGRLVRHAINMVTAFSVRPLHLATILGIMMSALGGVLMLFTVGRYIANGGSAPGFTTLASLMILFAGTQLVVLGVLGEYLSRIYLRVLDRPSYIVSRDTTT